MTQSHPYIAVGEAAKLLGLSASSIQKLVDNGKLAAVRTHGGHRRILRESLVALRQEMARSAAAPPQPQHAAWNGPADGSRRMRMLVVDDDEVVLAFFEGLVHKHLPDVELLLARDGIEAVMMLERQRPDVVVTDLNMKPFDGYRLSWLMHETADYRTISVVAITSSPEREIARRGGLPPNVALYRKPLSAERVLGFLEAQRQVRGGPVAAAA